MLKAPAGGGGKECVLFEKKKIKKSMDAVSRICRCFWK
jgi:hypothetical protein